MGARLWHLARGEDVRAVHAREVEKSISNETTFHADTGDREVLDGHLWRMAEKVSGRAKAKGHRARGGRSSSSATTTGCSRAGWRCVSPPRSPTPSTAPRAGFSTRWRSRGRSACWASGSPRSWPPGLADREGDLLDPGAGRRAAAERAADAIRARFGEDAILKGRALR